MTNEVFIPTTIETDIIEQSYKLVKVMTKKSDEQWYLWLRADKMLTTRTPDPRDLMPAEDVQSMYDKDDSWFKIHKFPRGGLKGLDREYIGENQLKVTYYFTTREQARFFFIDMNEVIPGKTREKERALKNKIREKYNVPDYVTEWYLYDQNGNDVSEYIR